MYEIKKLNKNEENSPEMGLFIKDLLPVDADPKALNLLDELLFGESHIAQRVFAQSNIAQSMLGIKMLFLDHESDVPLLQQYTNSILKQSREKYQAMLKYHSKFGIKLVDARTFYDFQISFAARSATFLLRYADLHYLTQQGYDTKQASEMVNEQSQQITFESGMSLLGIGEKTWNGGNDFEVPLNINFFIKSRTSEGRPIDHSAFDAFIKQTYFSEGKPNKELLEGIILSIYNLAKESPRYYGTLATASRRVQEMKFTLFDVLKNLLGRSNKEDHNNYLERMEKINAEVAEDIRKNPNQYGRKSKVITHLGKEFKNIYGAVATGLLHRNTEIISEEVLASEIKVVETLLGNVSDRSDLHR